MRIISKSKWFKFNNSVDGSAKIAELFIYGEITSYKWCDSDVTANEFKNDLESFGDIDQLDIFINSPGGSVFQGQAILSMINRFKEKNNIKVRMVVDGVAASAASFLLMAGDTIEMPENALLMIHNAWTYTAGNSEELRKAADDLEKINQSIINAYMKKAKVSEDKIKELMDAETWLNASDAKEIFDIEIIDEKDIAASIRDFEKSLNLYKNTPKFTFVKEGDKQDKVLDDNNEKEEVEKAIKKFEVISILNREW